MRLWEVDVRRYGPPNWGRAYFVEFVDAAHDAARLWQRHGFRAHLRRVRL